MFQQTQTILPKCLSECNGNEGDKQNFFPQSMMWFDNTTEAAWDKVVVKSVLQFYSSPTTFFYSFLLKALRLFWPNPDTIQGTNPWRNLFFLA